MDCVSRPGGQDFASFLHDYGDFHAHCVSRRVPDDFGQRVALERLADDAISAHPLAQPTLQVVVRVTRSPVCARAPVTLALTLRSIAAALTLARPRVRLEPLAALSARSLAGHRCCLLGEARSVTCSGLATKAPPFRRSARMGHFSRAPPGQSSRALKAFTSTQPKARYFARILDR
jgi:hypothetical protein